MSSEVEEVKNYLLEQINEQYKNYPDVKSKYSKYKTFEDEQVEGEEKSMITLDLHMINYQTCLISKIPFKYISFIIIQTKHWW